MAINKVVYGNSTLMDLSNDTATEDSVMEGEVFHMANGDTAVGKVRLADIYFGDEQPSDPQKHPFWIDTDETSGGDGGSAVEKEMTLLADIDITEATSSFDITDLDDLTEIYVESRWIQNETTTDSGLNLWVNTTRVAQNFASNRKNGTSTFNWSYARYIGDVWLWLTSPHAISDTNLNTSTAYIPYSLIHGAGKAKKISLSVASSKYAPITGNIKIWGR